MVWKASSEALPRVIMKYSTGSHLYSKFRLSPSHECQRSQSSAKKKRGQGVVVERERIELFCSTYYLGYFFPATHKKKSVIGFSFNHTLCYIIVSSHFSSDSWLSIQGIMKGRKSSFVNNWAMQLIVRVIYGSNLELPLLIFNAVRPSLMKQKP